MWSSCLFGFIFLGLGAGTNVPIGAIFNVNDEAALTALNYAFWLHNTNGTEPPDVSLNPFIEKYSYDDVLLLGQSVCKLIRQGIYTVLSPTSVLSFKVLSAYSNAFTLPLVSPGFPEVNERTVTKFGVSLKPSTTKAIADIIKFYKWQSVTYLYDTDEGPIVLQQLMKHVQNLKLDTEGFRRIYDADAAILILRQLLGTQSNIKRKIVLAMAPQLAKQILALYMRDPSLKAQDFHFLLTQLTTDDAMTSFGSVAVTHLRLVDPDNNMVKQFYRTWRTLPSNRWPHAGTQQIQENALLTYDAASVLISAYDRLHQDEPYIFAKHDSSYFNKSMIDCSQHPVPHFEHGPKIMQYIKQTHIANGLTGNIMFDASGNRRDYTLHVVESSPMEPILMGIWSDLSGLKVIHDSSHQFQGDNNIKPKSKVIITSVLVTPFLMETSSSASGNDKYEGYVKDLCEYLAEALNVDYEIRLSKDKKYGTFNQNTGEWSGMVGEVYRGEADWAVAPLTITSFREQYIDFTKPFQTVNLGIVTKKPEVKHIIGSSTFFFLNAFSYDVWLCLIAAYIAISVITYFVSRFTGSPDRIRSVETKESDHLSVSSSFWFSLGSLMFRGTGIYPRSLSHRFVSAVWWFFSIVAVTMYVSSLASLLIREHTASSFAGTLPYKDVIDVIESTVDTGKPDLGLLRGGSTESFFKNSNSVLYMKYAQYLKKNPNVMTTSYTEGVKRLRESDGDYAFIMEMTLGDYHSTQAPCDLAIIPGSMYSTGHGVGVKKNSEYKNLLDLALGKMRESGQLISLYHKWWRERSTCKDDKSRKFVDLYRGSLTLGELAGLFYILVIGVGVAIVAAALEYFCRTRNISLRNAAPRAIRHLILLHAFEDNSEATQHYRSNEI